MEKVVTSASFGASRCFYFASQCFLVSVPNRAARDVVLESESAMEEDVAVLLADCSSRRVFDVLFSMRPLFKLAGEFSPHILYEVLVPITDGEVKEH